MTPPRRSPIVELALVFLIALAARGVASARVAIVKRDGVEYLAAARAFATGDTRAALAHHYPPAYPFAVALVARATGGTPGVATGEAASSIAGALGAVLAAVAASLAFGRRAGVVTGLLAALHPAGVELGAAVTADALFATLVLGALAAALAGRSRPVWYGVAGGLAAASYLARPEGILVLPAIAAAAAAWGRGPGRAGNAALVLLPALAGALPYVVAIRPDASLNGGEAGAWKLTKKRELFLEAGGERVFPSRASGSRGFDASGAAGVLGDAGVRAATELGQLIERSWEIFAVLGVAGAIAAASPRRPAPRAPPRARGAALLLSGSAAALLAGYALIRVDTRYGEIVATVLLPLAGAALARLTGALEARRGRIVLALVLVALVPFAVRTRQEKKVTWREAGDLCRGHGRVASTDPRVAFYAGEEHVDLAAALRDASRPLAERAAAVTSAVARGGAHAIVLGPVEAGAPIRDPLVLALAEALGARHPSVRLVEHEGAETLAVIFIDPE